MSKTFIFVSGVVVFLLLLLTVRYFVSTQPITTGDITPTIETPLPSSVQLPVASPGPASVPPSPAAMPTKSAELVPPLPRSGERVTKKSFGEYISPQTSPVQPERFTGYHTGVDLEVLADEVSTTISVKAICTGEIKTARQADGYGGVVVQACTVQGQAVTVIYGHLNVSSLVYQIGDRVPAGIVLGNLGQAFSTQTDGERAHLHLGMHRGSEIDVRGYVDSVSELSAWLDPCLYVCHER